MWWTKNRKIVLLISLNIFFSCFGIKASAVFYVSSSEGNDSNPGSESRPLKSIAAIKEKNNVTVYLKRGDVFFECISGFTSSNISSYGNGNKPILCGFRILKDPQAWTSCGDGLWKIDLTNNDIFKGFQAVSATSKKNYLNVGILYDLRNDKIYGDRSDSLPKLKDEGSFFLASSYLKSDVEDFRWLYFRSTKNPSNLGPLCFSVGETAIRKIKKCHIDGLAVVGFGVHGITPDSGCIIENCDVDLIGGSLHTLDRFCRLGNGIQVWVANKRIVGDILVRNCQITRTYDTGTTIQGTKTNGAKVKNIHFTNNRIAYCRQAFERYLKPVDSDAFYDNCSFDRNLVFMSGYNQFGMKMRLNNVHLLSYELRPVPIDIYGNTFYGGNLQFSSFFSSGIRDNKVYIYDDEFLLYKQGSKIKSSGAGLLEKYKRESADLSDIIVIHRSSDIDKELKKQMIEKILRNFPIIDSDLISK